MDNDNMLVFYLLTLADYIEIKAKIGREAAEILRDKAIQYRYLGNVRGIGLQGQWPYDGQNPVSGFCTGETEIKPAIIVAL